MERLRDFEADRERVRERLRDFGLAGVRERLRDFGFEADLERVRERLRDLGLEADLERVRERLRDFGLEADLGRLRGLRFLSLRLFLAARKTGNESSMKSQSSAFVYFRSSS